MKTRIGEDTLIEQAFVEALLCVGRRTFYQHLHHPLSEVLVLSLIMDEERQGVFKKCAPSPLSLGSGGPGIKPALLTTVQ